MIKGWSSGQELVAAFMRQAGQKVRTKPVIDVFIAPSERLQAAGLVLEESLEVISALGCRIVIGSSGLDIQLDDTQSVRPAKVAHELTDLLYIVYGRAVTFGLPLKALFAEMHRSNMTRFRPDGSLQRHPTRDENCLDTYSPPDIEGVLREHD